MTVNANLLINDIKPGEDEGAVTWYPLPFVTVHDDEREYKGAYKHVNCLGMVKDGNTCINCKKVPQLPSFKKRILLRAEKTKEHCVRSTNKIRFEYLTSSEQTDAFRKESVQLEKVKSELFFAKAKTLRQKLKLRDLKDKLREFSKRGDMKAVTNNLIKAQEKGLLNDHKVLFDTIESVARNFHVRGPKGNRYKSSTRHFFESLLILGGPRIANFVAINMGGPNLNSIYRWRKINLISLKPGVEGENFRQYALIVKGVMELYKISPVPVLTAEDETAIVSVVQYHQDRDELLGFCGPKTDNPKDHICLENFHIHVGNGPNTFNTIVNAFESNKIGNYARVILINPLSKRIPKLVALLMPTCNRFDHHAVYRQWQNIQRCYSEHLEAILGPLVGHSSDGDSRRRKLQVQIMSCNVGDRFRPIPAELGFIFSARKETDNRMISGYVIRELGDQDPIHNHKKIINHLDHVSRMMFMGPVLTIHMNHIEKVLMRFPTFRHGLTRDHVRRDRDRQNWKVAQELTFSKVQDCLGEIMTGDEDHPPDPSVKGTKAFLCLVFHYVEIFFSATASLSTRIKYCGFVCHFLSIWRNFIHMSPGRTLTNNFLSRETYTDLLISVHFGVILICFCRDNFAQGKCYLDLVGSDCCEEFFSKNGQHVGNHHVFPYGQMFRNLSHMIRLNQIEVDDNAPAFAKAHIKQENVWHTQTPGGQTCSLMDYPLANTEIDEWKNGMTMARELAKDLGMKPSYFRNDNDDDPDNPDNGWFYSPFKHGDHFKLFKDLNNDETGDCSGDEDDDGSNGGDGDGRNRDGGDNTNRDGGSGGKRDIGDGSNRDVGDSSNGNGSDGNRDVGDGSNGACGYDSNGDGGNSCDREQNGQDGTDGKCGDSDESDRPPSRTGSNDMSSKRYKGIFRINFKTFQIVLLVL